MIGYEGRDGFAAERLAAGLWFVAGVLYLGSEGLAASAFSPTYSYAHNYISDLGVPGCGSIFDGRAICSPLHGLMNGDFVVQGLLFLAAALALARSLATPTKFVFIALAALNCMGNTLIGVFPEIAPGQFAAPSPYHVLGAILAIVFGNGTALMSAWTFRELRLARVHRQVSIALPLLAAVSLTMLARSAGPTPMVPAGVWERISVYAITIWELLSAACVIGKAQGR